MVETAGTARMPETARRLTWDFLTWWLQGSKRVRVEAVRSLDASSNSQALETGLSGQVALRVHPLKVPRSHIMSLLLHLFYR